MPFCKPLARIAFSSESCSLFWFIVLLSTGVLAPVNNGIFGTKDETLSGIGRANTLIVMVNLTV